MMSWFCSLTLSERSPNFLRPVVADRDRVFVELLTMITGAEREFDDDAVRFDRGLPLARVIGNRGPGPLTLPESQGYLRGAVFLQLQGLKALCTLQRDLCTLQRRAAGWPSEVQILL